MRRLESDEELYGRSKQYYENNVPTVYILLYLFHMHHILWWIQSSSRNLFPRILGNEAL